MKYEDIKAGDTISYTVDGIVYTGIAHHTDGWGDWVTAQGGEIAWQADLDEDRYTLVNRPAPEEPANLGAVVSASAYGSAAEEFVRVDTDTSDVGPWYDASGNPYTWDELQDVTVLHTGWDGVSIG